MLLAFSFAAAAAAAAALGLHCLYCLTNLPRQKAFCSSKCQRTQADHAAASVSTHLHPAAVASVPLQLAAASAASALHMQHTVLRMRLCV